MQNIRFVNIAVLWNLRFISYFMYQILAWQSLLGTNQKLSRFSIFSWHSSQNTCFLQSRKLHFFTFLFFYTINLIKIHKSEVCSLDPYKQCLRKIFLVRQKCLFLPSHVCNGGTFEHP